MIRSRERGSFRWRSCMWSPRVRPCRYAEGTCRGFQRRRDRDPDHDHGARVAYAGRHVVARIAARAVGPLGLRAQLRLPGYLLEQPPSHAGRRVASEWRGIVGEPAPALLALTDSVQHGM